MHNLFFQGTRNWTRNHYGFLTQTFHSLTSGWAIDSRNFQAFFFFKLLCYVDTVNGVLMPYLLLCHVSLQFVTAGPQDKYAPLNWWQEVDVMWLLASASAELDLLGFSHPSNLVLGVCSSEVKLFLWSSNILDRPLVRSQPCLLLWQRHSALC